MSSVRETKSSELVIGECKQEKVDKVQIKDITCPIQDEDDIHLLSIDEKLTEKTFNSSDRTGISPLFRLTLSSKGINLLAKNKNLINKISSEGLCSPCKDSIRADETPFFHLTKSREGIELLGENPQLLNLVTRDCLINPVSNYFNDGIPLVNFYMNLFKFIYDIKPTEGSSTKKLIQYFSDSSGLFKTIFSDKTLLNIILKLFEDQDGIDLIDRVYGIKLTPEQYKSGDYDLKTSAEKKDNPPSQNYFLSTSSDTLFSQGDSKKEQAIVNATIISQHSSP